MMADLRDCENDNNTDEIDRYLNDLTDNANDVLDFWKIKQQTYPKLANLARQIFATPASNSFCESDFSLALLVVSEKRSLLNPDTIEQIIFVKRNSHIEE